MRYLKLRKRGGGFVGVPADPPPCLSSERVGGETFTLVSVPLLDTDFEVTNSVEDIINALGAEVVDPSGFRYSLTDTCQEDALTAQLNTSKSRRKHGRVA